MSPPISFSFIEMAMFSQTNTIYQYLVTFQNPLGLLTNPCYKLISFSFPNPAHAHIKSKYKKQTPPRNSIKSTTIHNPSPILFCPTYSNHFQRLLLFLGCASKRAQNSIENEMQKRKEKDEALTVAQTSGSGDGILDADLERVGNCRHDEAEILEASELGSEGMGFGNGEGEGRRNAFAGREERRG